MQLELAGPIVLGRVVLHATAVTCMNSMLGRFELTESRQRPQVKDD